MVRVIKWAVTHAGIKKKIGLKNVAFAQAFTLILLLWSQWWRYNNDYSRRQWEEEYKKKSVSVTSVTKVTVHIQKDDRSNQKSNQTSATTSFVHKHKSPDSSSSNASNSSVVKLHSIHSKKPCTKDLQETGPLGFKSMLHTGASIFPKDIWPIPKPKRRMINKDSQTIQGSFNHFLPVQSSSLRSRGKETRKIRRKEKFERKTAKTKFQWKSSKRRKNRILAKSCKRKFIIHNYIPVSYTHLDVYKRQVVPVAASEEVF